MAGPKGVTIHRYSERGLVNAWIEDLRMSGMNKVRAFLEQAVLVSDKNKTLEDVKDYQTADIYVEHSLSDFGDPDVIFIFECDKNKKKMAIYTEFKLTPFLTRPVEDRTENDSRIDSQLYLKAAFHAHYVPEQKGKFPVLKYGKELRSIGDDKQVRELANILHGCNEVRFLAVTTDVEPNDEIVLALRTFQERNVKLEHHISEDHPCCLPKNTYMLSWHQIWRLAQKRTTLCPEFKLAWDRNYDKLIFPPHQSAESTITRFWQAYGLKSVPWTANRGFTLSPKDGIAVLRYEIVDAPEGINLIFTRPEKREKNRHFPDDPPKATLLRELKNSLNKTHKPPKEIDRYLKVCDNRIHWDMSRIS